LVNASTLKKYKSKLSKIAEGLKMKKLNQKANIIYLIVVISLIIPIEVNAIDVFELDPNYYISNSYIIPFDSAAIAFDAENNFYTVNKYDFDTTDPNNTIDILKYNSVTNSFDVYYTYTGRGISGLVFDSAGNLFIAEIGRIGGNLDVGRIDKIDPLLTTVSTIKELPDFRPTGIAVDSDGIIYFPGRTDSYPLIGSIYKLNPVSGEMDVFLAGYVGTAIAVDRDENIFFSTTSLSVSGQEVRTTYKYDPNSNVMTIFAKTDPTVEELAFDSQQRNIFVLEVTEFLYGEYNPPEMIAISPKVIDIKPRSYPNCFNINDHGVIPVAIKGSEYLDVNEVLLGSLNFAGLDVRVKGNGLPQCGYEDYNEDGYTDLVCKFEDDPNNWSPDNGNATLTFETIDGKVFEEIDSICIRP
jgi:streptogramin lyase